MFGGVCGLALGGQYCTCSVSALSLLVLYFDITRAALRAARTESLVVRSPNSCRAGRGTPQNEAMVDDLFHFANTVPCLHVE